MRPFARVPEWILAFALRSPRSAIFVFFCFLASPLWAVAEPIKPPSDPSSDAKAYEAAISGRRIDAAVEYHDPLRDAPELKIRGKAPELERDDETEFDLPVEKWGVVFIAVIFLAVIVTLGSKFGGASSVSITRGVDRRRRPARSRAPAAEAALPVAFADRTLQDIARIEDPREAIIALGVAALRRAADANGLGVGRSWTMRDVLRRLPQDWPHLHILLGIARAAELTHFGGRDFAPEDLRAHLEAARPIFGEADA